LHPQATRPPEACPGRIPTGFRRLPAPVPQALVIFGFTSRVAVKNGHSYFYYDVKRPPHPDPRYGRLACAGSSDFGQTDSDYAAGQRVVLWSFEGLSCRGVARGNITLVITTGPTAPVPTPAASGQTVGREVGHFSFKVP
jgi:hypothetical protein